MLRKFYNLSMLFERPHDLPAVWSVHVLDLDVVTQGDNLQHALQMALEAASMVVDWDLQHNADPLDRRAPDEFWDKFHQLVLHGHATEGLDVASERDVQALALQGVCGFQLRPVELTERLPDPRHAPPAPVAAQYRQLLTWPQQIATM